MGRKPGFTDEQVFVWLSEHLAQAPGVTVQQVSKGTGVSVGSLYHRYGSMEGLLAEAWIWAQEHFSRLIVPLLKADGERAATRAALEVLNFVNANKAAATLLFLVPERYLVRPGLDLSIMDRVAEARDLLTSAISDFAKRINHIAETVELAVLQLPASLAEKYLPHGTIPPQAELYVRKTCRMILSNPLEIEEVEHA